MAVETQTHEKKDHGDCDQGGYWRVGLSRYYTLVGLSEESFPTPVPAICYLHKVACTKGWAR
jgi:hypothetical protein